MIHRAPLPTFGSIVLHAMARGETIVLLIELSVMLMVGLVLGQAMTRLRLPAVAGELLGGIVIGPTVLGRVSPRLFAILFPTSTAVALGRETFVQLGLLTFMFTAGLQMNVPALSRLGRKVLWTSALGIVLPMVVGAGMVFAAPERWAIHIRGRTPDNALFLGTALSISALPVIARILIDLDLAHQELGALILASAALDDLIGWSLFTAILSSFEPRLPLWVAMLLVTGLAGVTLTLGRWVVRRARRLLPPKPARPGLVTALAAFWLLAAAGAELSGVHATLGAFIAGLIMASPGETRDTATKAIPEFALGVFAPLYFVSVGLRADFASSFDPSLTALVLVIACLGKIGGASVGARIGGTRWRKAFAVGFGLNVRGAMEMILATVALEQRMIDQRLFVALVVMAVVTSILSGPILSRQNRAPWTTAATRGQLLDA
jgi:Kef-type K+ transport system membrane component KefB